jgi:polysaccharide biosynthesis/export protein
MNEKSTKNSVRNNAFMLRSSLLARAGAVLSAFSIMIGGAGCAHAQPPPAAAAAPVAESSDNNYTIGPGDSLNVFVWRNEDLSTTVAVRPDGKISIPLVDDMQAVGKTPSQLKADIEGVLAEFVRSPDVTVIVSSFGIGAYDNQIRVVGAGAVRPQAIPFRQGLTLLDVMIEVGLSEFAAGDRAKLVRRRGDETEETSVKLNRLVNRGDLSQNHALQPGDVVIIPQSRF